MNTPAPIATPGSTPLTVPSLGAFLGTAGGLLLANKMHLDPTDPFTGGALVSAAGTFTTALFHWLHRLAQKVGSGAS